METNTDNESNVVAMETTAPVNLATALAKAQACMRAAERSRQADVTKDKTVKRKYSTLADVWDACREPLTSNGLSVTQIPRTLMSDSGQLQVEVLTRLMHGPSGEQIEGTLVMPIFANHPQAIGTGITYARRYALSAIVGIAPDDDDDGEEASRGAPPSEHRGPPQEGSRRVVSQGDKPGPSSTATPKSITKETYKLLSDVYFHFGTKSRDIKQAAGVPTSGVLSPEQDAQLAAHCRSELENVPDEVKSEAPA